MSMSRERALVRPQIWRYPPETVLMKHPLNAEPDVAGEDFEEMVSSMNRLGFNSHRAIDTYDGKVLDGWTRYRAAKVADVWFDVHELDPKTTPEDFVKMADTRRHKTPEQVAARRGRVVVARAGGATLREIAATEGVSHVTVAKDLAAVNPVNREAKSESETHGLAGREYTSQAPPSPKKKAGKELFDWKAFEQAWMTLYREPDLLDRLRGVKESPGADRLRDMLTEWKTAFWDEFDSIFATTTKAKAPRKPRK